jgi:hypothetical protein
VGEKYVPTLRLQPLSNTHRGKGRGVEASSPGLLSMNLILKIG